jgi:hypothetical protein
MPNSARLALQPMKGLVNSVSGIGTEDPAVEVHAGATRTMAHEWILVGPPFGRSNGRCEHSGLVTPMQDAQILEGQVVGEAYIRI